MSTSTNLSVPDLPGTLDISLKVPKKKIPLHDGVGPVRSIAVISILRDCEPYVPYMFKLLNTIIATYDCEFEFYFLESDSKDNTQALLSDWIDEHEGNLLVYSLKKDYVRTSHGIDHKRVSTISMLRNKIVDAITPLQTDWCLLLDSHMYFDPSVVAKLFATKPALSNYGMVCGYTNKVYPMSIIKPEIKEQMNLTEQNKMVSVGHYNDTFSLVDRNFKMHHPMCPFEKCKLCTTQRPGTNRTRIPEEDDVVEMRACYGGLALVSTEALNHPNVRWDTISYESKMDLSTCEHLLFCERLRAVTGKKVVIVQSVDSIFRTK